MEQFEIEGSTAFEFLGQMIDRQSEIAHDFDLREIDRINLCGLVIDPCN
jgi:hypothetical protein